MFSWLRGTSGNATHRPRSAERFAVQGLRCALGDVVDISAAGLRVKVTGSASLKRGETVTLNVTNDQQAVRVMARVIWMRRGGVGRPSEVGLRFVDVRAGVAAALVQLGRFGFISTDGSGAGEAPGRKRAEAPPVRASIEVEDLYAILGVPPSAAEGEIRRAYHALAQQYHPDRNSSPDAADRFAMISKAWKVLRDPGLRAKYDQLLARCKAA
jgi:DnaJ-domain-containing protein 1